MADWCVHTLERLKLGLTFPRGYYDCSYILVGKKTKEGGSAGRGNLFSWLKPFKPSVWCAIIATIVVSAIAFAVLENMNLASTTEHWYWSRNFFHSFFMFSQHFEFNPQTHANWVFATSLAIWSLIILEVYV